jgi:hypothetical protein
MKLKKIGIGGHEMNDDEMHEGDISPPWPESASELYRPSHRRLCAKLAITFLIEDLTWSAWRIPTTVFSIF